ncbi:MAG: hypothetical protein ACO3MV_00740 [Flavobacteriales bacterium]
MNFRHQPIILLLIGALAFGCNRDNEVPEILLSEPAFDGFHVQFGDLLFVEFEVSDAQGDGGIWRVELRAGDGVSVKTAQAGIWEGNSTGTLVTAFNLNASSWPTGPMVLALVADDAAGNRAAVFKDFQYTSEMDVPEVFGILTNEGNDISTLLRINGDGELISEWTDLPAAHAMAYSNGVLALADQSAATIHLINWTTGESLGNWNDQTTAGSEPLIRSIYPLGIQAGFVFAHAGGIVVINSDGALLFERFTEAPWSPVDVRFDGTLCIVWEENAATSNHRLRSWDFQTGAVGPTVALAHAPEGWGVVSSQDSGTEGNVFFVSESGGLTLCKTSTGVLNDLCPLLGQGNLNQSPKTATDFLNQEAIFIREEGLCKQSIAPVSSGSIWPASGIITQVKSSAENEIFFIQEVQNSLEFWQWTAEAMLPSPVLSGLPLNTQDVLIVND